MLQHCGANIATKDEDQYEDEDVEEDEGENEDQEEYEDQDQDFNQDQYQEGSSSSWCKGNSYNKLSEKVCSLKLINTKSPFIWKCYSTPFHSLHQLLQQGNKKV